MTAVPSAVVPTATHVSRGSQSMFDSSPVPGGASCVVQSCPFHSCTSLPLSAKVR